MLTREQAKIAFGIVCACKTACLWHETGMTSNRHTQLAAYVAKHFAPEPRAWAERRALGESLRAGLQMSAHEGALVAWLLRLHGAKNVIEIGSFIGVSALWLACGLPADGRVISIERDGEYAALARETLKNAGEARVEIVEDDALAVLKQMPHVAACAVFLDGEKRTYPEMLEAVLPHLRAGALIIADNTLLFGAVMGEEPTARVSDAQLKAMERFHMILADNTRFDTMIMPTVEGLTVAIVKA